jgi:GntR family transcriptional regulator/MocR family aminotransferase
LAIYRLCLGILRSEEVVCTMTAHNTSSRDPGPLDRASPVPLYLQLRDALRADIDAGRLPPGARLPSVRVLAARLRLNANTVVHAYRLLEEDGTVEAHAAKGTFVRARPARAMSTVVSRPIPAVSPGYPVEGARGALPRALVAPPHGPAPVGLASGTPAPDLFPTAHLRRLLAAVVDEEGPSVLNYGPADGDPGLRAAAAGLLAAGGIEVSADDLLVTTGAQQAIDLVARALLAPGDAVVVEAPTYPGALASFERAGCRLVPVPMTPRGPDPLALEAAFARYQPRLVYTVPTFHNPTGWTTDPDGRDRLVALAARGGAFVLEDDHVADLRFEGPAVAALAARDPGRVLHVRGFAKTVAPGLRLAVLAAPPAVRSRVLALKLSADLYAPPLEQRVLARFLADGYAAHVAGAREAYRRRRDLAVTRLGALPGLELTPPAGGLNVWVALPTGMSAEALEREALAAGVAVAPGGLFFPDRSEGDGFVRVSYGTVPETRLAEGLDRLETALRRLADGAAARIAVPLV